MKSHRGSITVMLILVLCAILMAVTLVVEVARVRIAEGQARRAVDTAIFSALAAYDQDTKDDYGLFYRYGTDGLKDEIQSAVEKSLLINDGSSSWHPYEYNVEAMDVRILFPLNDTESLRHQIVEHMKYRGPAELIGDTAEKLKAFFSMQSTAKVMKADLAVDMKIKKLSELINQLKDRMGTVSGYTDSELGNFNGYAMRVAGMAMNIKSMEKKIDKIKSQWEALSPEDAEMLASLQDHADSARDEMQTAGESLLNEIETVLTANTNALEICKELKRLGVEIERAIGNAESVMSKDENVIPGVQKDLKEKYAEYRQYTNVKDLDVIIRALESNVSLLEPKREMLRDLLAGTAPGGRPSAFETLGYKTTKFAHADYSTNQEKGTGTAVNITPETVYKLMAVAKSIKEKLERTVGTTDRGSVQSCRGNSFSEAEETPLISSGNSYEAANDTLSSAYGQIGKDVDSRELMDGLADGTLKLGKEAFESLLINEYVLATFNNREEGGRAKHVMKETEVEYVLVGSQNPQVNAAVSQLEIIAWRTVFNTVSFGYCCPEITRAIDSAAAVLNGATGVPYPVWKGIITGLLALVESVLDTMTLFEDESIAMLKFRVEDTSFLFQIKELAAELGIKPTANFDAEKNSNEKLGGMPAKNLKVDYEDHLRAMLMYRSLLGQEQVILRRIQDLIYTNISDSRGEYDSSIHFNFIEVDAKLSIKSFFPSISAINAHLDGVPMRHVLNVECGRGY